MAQYKGYFIDLDGTIYQGTKQIPAAQRFIDRLKAAHIPYLFVTNNSTKSPAEVAANLTKNHNILTAPEQVYTSSMATADYLKTIAQANKKHVYVIGENGLKQALKDAGFILTDTEDVDFVVAGLDRQFNYEKLTTATLAIQKGATFIATNRDTNLPNERGMLPGAGSLISAIQTATDIKPIVIAKPEIPIMTGALKKLSVSHTDAVMVGDNYYTDILAGINAGINTLLVYSGVSSRNQMLNVAQKPTHEIDNLDEWLI